MSNIFNISTDMGTSSDGWAVVDNTHNIIKYKKDLMWGVRTFNEGKTAKERRSHRSVRRTLERRRQRLTILQSIFDNEIQNVDPLFFRRLQDSFLHLEDRFDKENKSNLFVGDINEREYYKQYPTIYHLRKELIENPEKKDIRLVYIAVHNILKYRGNFLYEKQSLDNITGNIEHTIQDLIDIISCHGICDLNLTISNIKDTILDKNLSRTEKVNILKGTDKLYKDKLRQIFNGIVGLEVNLSKLFNDIDFDEDIKFKFSDEDIDSKLESVEDLLDQNYELLEIMQQIYSFSILGSLLNLDSTNLDSIVSKYVSNSKVASYNKFSKELRIIKDIVYHYDKEFYKHLFRSKDVFAYESYMKNSDRKEKNKIVKFEFYKSIKAFIEKYMEDDYLIEEKKYILREIEAERLLIKQNIKDNSAIPYQLHEMELKKILQNQSKYYPFLKESMNDILLLLTFRVPYYIGPLNSYSQFSWCKRVEGKEQTKITPFNIHEVIDFEETTTNFIKNLTNKCKYLIYEFVLPRHSLLYSDYLYYDEINRLKINNNLLTAKQKEDLLENVFLVKSTVSQKDIESWYKKYSGTSDGECIIEGLHGDKAALASLKPYIDFIGVFKVLNPGNKDTVSIYREINSKHRDMIEDIIEWISIAQSKEFIETKMKNKYPHIADNKEAMKKILKLKYKGWGAFSKMLLDEIKTTDSFGHSSTILDILKSTNQNFMQIINSEKYNFTSTINEINNLNISDEITYDNLVKNLPCSPKVKKCIWQNIKLIDEIITLKGAYPQNIFIEFARSDEKSKRTMPRKSAIEKPDHGRYPGRSIP